jgi:protein TonB
MSVYATTPAFADRRPHPRALLLIVAGHAALIAAVRAAKMDLPERILNRPLVVELIRLPKPPPPEPQPQHRDPVAQPMPQQPVQQVPIEIPDQQTIDTTPSMDPVPIPIGPIVDPIGPGSTIVADPVRVGPRFMTPASDVQPPYPESKRRLEEEAVLRLRLAIGSNGRVTAVEPVGAADRAFFDAARRHILAHWRYKPATVDGRGVASSTVVTLRFELDE